MKGKIHSIESMGLVDGPGIRTVIFFQGCNLRCKYCHNPDTWVLNSGTEMTVEEIIKKVLRFKVYYKDGGGVTISGGDPLLQWQFLIALLKELKENGIHTCLDTSGNGVGHYEKILEYVDLILYDIKHYDEKSYKEMTSGEQMESLKFLKAAQKKGTKLWLRHVVIPGISDSESHISKLRDFARKIDNVEKIELLPYHVMGDSKYATLGIKNPLDGIEPMDKNKAADLTEKYFSDFNK